MSFMDDLASRLASRAQLTSDGHKAYLEAVEGAFGGDVDYAMLVKLYSARPRLFAALQGAKRHERCCIWAVIPPTLPPGIGGLVCKV